MLLRRVREGSAGEPGAARRTVGELLRRAEVVADERRRRAAEKAEAERARRERQAARVRAKHLDGLAGKESALWQQVEELVATKKPRAYDEAIALLVDLRDLAARGDGPSFDRRIEALLAEHAHKRSFLERLDGAALVGRGGGDPPTITGAARRPKSGTRTSGRAD